MVFATIFPKEANHFEDLRDALAKLKLNDASLSFKPESSSLGRGFRAGFLGLLHLDITLERLRREYKMELVVSSPAVGYQFAKNNNQVEAEPWVKIDIISQEKYIGSLMAFAMSRRGEYINTEYLLSVKSEKSPSERDSLAGKQLSNRVILHFHLPLSAMLVNFYDGLKSLTQGYASFSYEFLAYRPAAISKLEILIANEKKEAFTTFIHQDEAYYYAKNLLLKLKAEIPRHLFEIKLQAALSGRIIAAEKIPPLRKDVTAKLYGGDVTRKMKLLEKQKKGKKKLKAFGSVEIPQSAYLAVMGSAR